MLAAHHSGAASRSMKFSTTVLPDRARLPGTRCRMQRRSPNAAGAASTAVRIFGELGARLDSSALRIRSPGGHPTPTRFVAEPPAHLATIHPAVG